MVASALSRRPAAVDFQILLAIGAAPGFYFSISVS
jgi:hypothetical protein